MTKNWKRNAKFRRRADEQRRADGGRLLTAVEIAWRERLEDNEYEFQPTEVKWTASPKHSTVLGMKDDAPLEYVHRLYGPQLKTVQYTRTVRLTPDPA